MFMDGNTRHILARNVLALRELAGWSQAQLAKKAGVAQTAISYIERESKAASLDTIEAIADAFRVEPWSLLIETGPNAAPADRRLASLVDAFAQLADDGKDEIARVAEREIKYRR